MKTTKFFDSRFLRPRNLVIIFLTVATLLVTSAVIELRNSRQELFELMEKQSHSLLETILITSDNALLANEELENLLRERLLNNGVFVRSLSEQGALHNRDLRDLVRQNHIHRIDVINREGAVLYTSAEAGNGSGTDLTGLLGALEPLFRGVQDSLVLGRLRMNPESTLQYVIAMAAPDERVIVLSMDAADIMAFRRQIGFGGLLRKYIDNPGIVYVALQNYSGIIAASGNVQELERLQDSPFLTGTLDDSTYATRITPFDSLEVFETVHPFYYQNNLVGVFRLGLSLDPLQDINARIFRRMVIITFALLGVGFLVFLAILARQNVDIMQRQYQVVETYSNNIIQVVGDGIVVFDEPSGVKIYNAAAEEIFGFPREEVLGEKAVDILGRDFSEKISRQSAPIQEISCVLRGHTRHLLVSRTTFQDEHDTENTILVLRDLTEQKKLEEQIQRKERLSAMGELASGVAHEIRNPLNTIGMIIQHLDRDFQPNGDGEEYHNLNQLVYKEVRRINETVQNFLRFARPESMSPEQFHLGKLLQEMEQQYRPMAEQKDVEINLAVDEKYQVTWDRKQMQQVLMNLVQNALDAMDKSGSITLTASALANDRLELRIRDSGPGIPDEVLEKIFNLYFTTKPKGTGIGLAIVQRIIYEHGGTISVESAANEGTTFIIRMPMTVSEHITSR